jgi:NADH-quinone oxidoreductase subunit A
MTPLIANLQLPTNYWPLLVYLIAVVVLTISILVISYFLGQRHRDIATGEPYESGVISTGTARVRYDVKFYLNAMFFVIFDLETAFIVTWAIALRESGWVGYIEMVIFTGILLASLVYLWRLGALDWRTSREKRSVYQGKKG